MLYGALHGLFWCAAIAFLWWLGRRFSDTKRKETAIDRPDIPYSIYTDAFDVELRACELVDLLKGDGIVGEVPSGEYNADLSARKEAFRAAYSATGPFPPLSVSEPSEQSVCFLIDLSGSMAARLPGYLGELRGLVEWLDRNGVRTAVYGFTTRGWRGGLARERWHGQGRAEYPGRLCSLMHVIISDFRHSGEEEDWGALLRPDVLRENIDGEALRWATGRLAQEKSSRRSLFVLSDGAPVDDSTIMENGSGFLWRDLLDAIAYIERENQIDLFGIGLSYRVDELYSNSAFVDEGGSLVKAILPLLRIDPDTAIPGDPK